MVYFPSPNQERNQLGLFVLCHSCVSSHIHYISFKVKPRVNCMFVCMHRGGIELRVCWFFFFLSFVIRPCELCWLKSECVKDFWKIFLVTNWIMKNIPINQSAKLIAPDALPFHLSPSGFKYLGVTISPCLSSLQRNISTEWTEKIKLDPQRWSMLPLSPCGSN